MIIYLDLIFLANFLLDYSLLAYTGLINQEKKNYLRLVVASLFGLLSLVLFYIQVKWLFFLLRIIFSLGIIYLAYSYTSLRQFIKNLVIFYFLNYVTAGILVSHDFKYTDNSIFVNYNQPITWYLLIFSFLFANVLTYIYKVIEEKKSYQKNSALPIKFRLFNQEYQVLGLVDTGNRVTSPIDKVPVVFVSKKIITINIDEDFLIKNNIPFTYIKTKTINDEFLALAFKPETFAIKYDDWVYKDVYFVLFDNENLLQEDFNAILNYQLIS